MFQIVVDILLVCLVLYGFLQAIFWIRRKTAPAPGKDSEGRE